ncbi:MAG: flagellar hook-basal body protein [Agathobacter sp.]|nr:flagellar hook-basal body protein [Agathobacter sp.]
MMRALYTAATGMISEQTNVDTIANNLSNVNTYGYKAQRTEFKSLLYQTIQTRTTSANGDQKPVGAQVGLGTRIAATTSLYTQGNATATEGPTDFMIDGKGFFAVRGTDGNTYYTRNGAFTWSLAGDGTTMLADAAGNPVLDRNGNTITIPNGVTAENMVFSENGEIGYMTVAGAYVSLNQFFGIYQFNNPAGLEKLGGSLLGATGASGNPLQEGTTAGLKQSEICKGFLEGSNVAVADEMVNLIVAQRAYELNSKAITTADSMLETANNLKR